jgi:hypothetical protein
MAAVSLYSTKMETEMKTIIFLSAEGLLLVSASSTYAHDVDPYHDGWVSHVNDHQLEICYRHAPPPTVGESVQILQPWYITVKQGPVLQRFTQRGNARITSSGSDGCVLAEMIDGSAGRSDHARAAG